MREQVDLSRIFSDDDLIDMYKNEVDSESWQKFQAYKQFCLRRIEQAKKALMVENFLELDSLLWDYCGFLGKEEVLNFDFFPLTENSRAVPFGEAIKRLKVELTNAESVFGKGCLNPKKKQEYTPSKCIEETPYCDYKFFGINVLEYLYTHLYNNDFEKLKNVIGRDELIKFTRSEEEMGFFLEGLKAIRNFEENETT